MKLDDAAAGLEALGNPTRLKIYRALIRAGGAGLAVGRLQEKLKIAPSTLSHHIKSLVVVGLVTQQRDATTLICHANYEVMRELLGFLAAECCAESAETTDAKTANSKTANIKTANTKTAA
jgi:DNA-binding transcriptional ArsR family regulator